MNAYVDEFVACVKTCLQDKYFQLSGRSSRPEFWWFMLLMVVASIVAGVIGGLIHWSLQFLLMLPLFPPSFSVGWRRFQDLGKPGYYILAAMISLPFTLLGTLANLPFLIMIGGVLSLAATIFLIYMLIQPGEPQANEFGAPLTA